jgi:thymidylate synthase (FAD)
MNSDNTISLYDDGIGSVSYIQHVGSDKMFVNAARVSFGQDNSKKLLNKDKALIKYLLEHKHTSPFEHSSITFKFVVPLFVRSQHHRHRTWAYNEISRRYTEKDIQFYEPQEFRTQHKSNRQASNEEDLTNPYVVGSDGPSGFCWSGFKADLAMKTWNRGALQLYEELMKKGVCREQARMVLPQSLYTEYYGTVSVLNLLKFIDLRTHEGAQWEIQKAAEACLEIAAQHFPETIKIWKELKDG